MPDGSRIVFINRSFWPIYPVIGEALLQVAERLSPSYNVSVITQSAIDLKAEMTSKGRGQGVEVRACKARSDSSTHLAFRILDALVFMAWVFLVLCRLRPKKIYVSTDPPVVVPFVVSVYALFSGAHVIYHLQDIHPEAANIVVPLHPAVMRALKAIDSWSMRRASQLITLSQDMADVMLERSRTKTPIKLMDNPAVCMTSNTEERTKGLIFCGNAGRMQRIPLLIEAITAYRLQSGTLPFEFVGGGVYSAELTQLSNQVSGVTYLGQVPSAVAAERVASFDWAILSIDDEVTRYAFPSKSSTYALSGSHVLAVCGRNTSVAKWVVELDIGRVCDPNVSSVVAAFFEIERTNEVHKVTKPSLRHLEMSYFVESLIQVIND